MSHNTNVDGTTRKPPGLDELFTSRLPKRRSFRATLGVLRHHITAWVPFVVTTLSSFDTTATGPEALTPAHPPGNTEPHLPLIREMYGEEHRRRDTLESKAGALLSLTTVLVPLLVSTSYYVLSADAFGGWPRVAVLICMCMSIACLILAFFAAFRANSVNEVQVLRGRAILNPTQCEVRPYSGDFEARGLLWCTCANIGLNDHIANFVKASQLFLCTSVVVLLLGGALSVIGIVGFRHDSSGLTAAMVGPSNSVDVSDVQRTLGQTAADLMSRERELGDIEERIRLLRSDLRRLSGRDD